jgi:hypothetical protein
MAAMKSPHAVAIDLVDAALKAFRPNALWNEDEDYNPLKSKTFKVEQPVEGFQLGKV